MKHVLQIGVIILIITFLISCSGCSTGRDDQTELAPSELEKPFPKEELCGNNFCDDVEFDIGNCPEDCADVGEGVVYLGLMIHLEGWEEPDGSVDEIKYYAWTDRAKELATVLEEYDAKGTFEAHHELVLASELYGDDTLNELYGRGHGIGVHADLGGPGSKFEGYTTEDMTSDMEEMRVDMERITGLDIRHVSGICSEVDWVQAALDAGYEFTTGGVMMCGLSLDEKNIPAGYTRKDFLEDYHGILPDSVEERLHPWRAATGTDWLTPAEEGLVILASDGVIEGMYEQYGGNSGHMTDQFNQDDIDQFISSLEESISLSRSDRVNQMYVAVSIGNGMDESVTRDWLEAIEPYVESGQVEWKTLPEIYDAYVAWEATI